MKKQIILSSLLLASLFLLAIPAMAGNIGETEEGGIELAEVEANKAAFAEELAARWEAEALERGNDNSWLERHSGTLSELDAETLLSMNEAETYDEFIGLQTTSELVFYPLKPCRIVDTRFATRWGPFGTPVGSGQTIPVRTYPSLAGQGGASNCGVLSTSAAVVVNVTSVPVSGGQGFLTVWPFGQSRPTASLVNYNSGSTSGAIANAVSQSQCRSCSNELNVYASRTSHVIIDVIGYFARNTRTPVDNFQTAASFNVPNNSNFNIYSPPCPSGYRLTGGGFVYGTSNVNTVVAGSRGVKGQSFAIVTGLNQADRWLCQGRNQAGFTQLTYCLANCARIPGR